MPRAKRASRTQPGLFEARVTTAPCVPAIHEAVGAWREDYARTALPSANLPRKRDSVAAQKFTYEGYDLITLEKLVEREYTLPEAQTAPEVISYYLQPADFADLLVFASHPGSI